MCVDKRRSWFKSSPPGSSQRAATLRSVMIVLLGERNSPTNLPIIAARLRTCHQGTTDPQCPKINTLRPSEGLCYPRGCQYCRLGIKEHFISTCDSKKERKRERLCESEVMEGIHGCLGWPVYIKAPQGGSKVMCHPSWLSTGPMTNCLISLQCVVFTSNRMKGQKSARHSSHWPFSLNAVALDDMILDQRVQNH